MLNGKFVIDAVAHGFDNSEENMLAGRYSRGIVDNNYDFQDVMMPERYRMTREQYYQRMTADWVASALFAESVTDVAVYHPLATWGVFKDLSPAEIGLEIRERAKGRMFMYAAVSPLQGSQAIEELERQVEEWEPIGLKLYPVEIIDGKMHSFSMGDEKIAYPIFERARALGIKNIGIHKALPLGTAPLDPFLPQDVDYAARDWPDMNFEIVHGGFAFLDETAFQMARFDNIYINLEATAQLILKQPGLYARILGALLFNGGAKRIVWATGAAGAGHPQPILEAFEQFQMPRSLVEDYGYPELTEEMKADILAGNYMRMHGLSLEELQRGIEGDEFAAQQAAGLAEPWSRIPAPAGA